MKKGTILILTYMLVVVALVVCVRAVKIQAAKGPTASSKVLIAACGDPTPPATAGE